MKPAPFTHHRASSAKEAVSRRGALAPLGVRATALPATPARIVGWIEDAGAR